MNKVEMKIKSVCLGIMGKVLDKWQKDLKREMRKNQPIVPISKIDSSDLYKDFNCAKQMIMENNSRNLIFNKYIPEVIKDTLKRDNYLTTETSAFPEAVQRFMQDKKDGLIDELNRYVGQKKTIKGG